MPPVNDEEHDVDRGDGDVDPLPEHVLTTHRQRLEAFMVRARRIEAHSLLSDRDQFVKWVSCSGRIHEAGWDTPEGRVVDERTMTVDLPSEETFESLATRVRPLMLQNEQAHHGKVFGSLKAFVRDDPERRQQADDLRDAWRQIKQPDAPILMAIVSGLERPNEPASYVDVADAWLYSDLVHCDQQWLERAGGIPLRHRYLAGVLVYGQAALHAVATLNLIRQWQTAGVLDLGSTAADEPVTVDVPLVLPVHQMNIYQAESQDDVGDDNRTG